MVEKAFAAIPLLIFLPALGALVTGLAGKRLGQRASAAIATAAVFGSFGIAVYTAWLLLTDPDGGQVAYTWHLYTFVETIFLKVDVGFVFDRLSAAVVPAVTCISGLVHLYAIGRVWGERSFSRFFSYLNMLVFFMLLLVLGRSRAQFMSSARSPAPRRGPDPGVRKGLHRQPHRRLRFPARYAHPADLQPRRVGSRVPAHVGR